ncbi:DUF4854 domain-containing protein [uncultured Neglectibacter sp.]|uniref:DUF4854 domain-containing protein n=1 Tax=uncultured Neglectibacter sp. TaxID=1924108 RepID=UPI0034DEA72D
MKRKTKSVLCALAMAVVILLSIFLGGVRSLKRQRTDILDNHYFHDESGFAVTQGLNRELKNVRDMVALAQNYATYVPWIQNYIDSLDYQADFCENSCRSGTPEEAAAYHQLCLAAETLYGQLWQIELKETDLSYPQWQEEWETDQAFFGSYLELINSTQSNLKRSSYNENARQFNELLDRFPGSVLKRLFRIEKLGVFSQAEETGDGYRNADGKYQNMQAYVESPYSRAAEKGLNEELAESQVQLKILAEGNILIYAYTHETLKADEMSVRELDEIIASDENVDTEKNFIGFAEFLAFSVEGADGVVRIQELDKDGEEIFSKDFKAQE